VRWRGEPEVVSAEFTDRHIEGELLQLSRQSRAAGRSAWASSRGLGLLRATLGGNGLPCVGKEDREICGDAVDAISRATGELKAQGKIDGETVSLLNESIIRLTRAAPSEHPDTWGLVRLVKAIMQDFVNSGLRAKHRGWPMSPRKPVRGDLARQCKLCEFGRFLWDNWPRVRESCHRHTYTRCPNPLRLRYKRWPCCSPSCRVKLIEWRKRLS
jgi:hypothetical protein